LKKRLKSERIAYAELKSDVTPTSSSVRMATMHNMKGLEFKCVLLMGVNDGAVPPKFKSADQVSAADRERQERSLFYVAATRARDYLVITGHGSPSRFVGVG
ncbi:MAG: 3'-5' exonuclease, partial [Myxococcota bacterium]